ncbi:probable 60S ribosomal protein L14 isoform X1 [Papaver somniferum]|uniref:probable 60S ribosomal protein L14 isoform X1 n=1 Tax=Papaver somniferum TaxID=3469 RepID=UPI000E6FE41B|nr:probable 60S ribosomal protein L14 isoform X1 [Papaver somniferum]
MHVHPVESLIHDPDKLADLLYHSFPLPEISKMPFKRYVEIGRVLSLTTEKIMALVDAPDMVRSQMSFKRLSLTDIKIDIGRTPKKKVLIRAMEVADVKKKWESSSWDRKFIVQKKRASLNDFDRFKVMLAKIKRGKAIHRELKKLKEVAARREIAITVLREMKAEMEHKAA